MAACDLGGAQAQAIGPHESVARGEDTPAGGIEDAGRGRGPRSP